MYKILGGDQKEYGPVTAEQVREWLAQRRLNAQTLVQRAPGILPGSGPETRQDAGGTLQGAPEWIPLSACPEFAVAAPDNPVSVIIPYKNPKALIAYYLGIFSLIPCLGLALGIAAVVLGVLGLKAAQAQPNARGKVHAWVGIILGGLCVAGNLVAIVLMIISMNSNR